MLIKLGVALLLAIGIGGIVYHYSTQIVDWLRLQSLGTRDYVVEKLQLMFIEIAPDRVLLYMVGAALGGFALGFLIFFPQWPPGLIFGSILGGVLWKAPKPFVNWLVKRRNERFVLQMVESLSLLSNGLKSGLAINQAMGLVAQEMPSPTKDEFNLVLSENKLGVSIEDSFNNLAKRVQAEEVEMFVTAINILKETGGNLAETFDTISYTLRERIKAEGKISALTAAGFYQGMVMFGLPPGLMAILYVQDPEYMSPLFTTALGWVILGIIAILMTLGLIIILTVVKVDV